MSRKVPREQYENTRSYRIKQWYEGTKDPFLDTVEMKPQKPFAEDVEAAKKRMKEKRSLMKQIYDTRQNAEVRIFRKIYRVSSVLFCIFLVAMLLVAVSNLPTFGDPTNPVNNEVAARYIENGLQETGAVNIVTGMILDYRAFDTPGRVPCAVYRYLYRADPAASGRQQKREVMAWATIWKRTACTSRKMM